MPKNLLQDMVRIKRESRKEQVATEPRSIKRVEDSTRATESEALSPIQNRGRSKHAIWVVAVISIIFFLFSVSFLFLEVTVTVNPKMKDITLNENLSASADAGTEALPFNLMVISEEENKTMQTTLNKDVSEKAKGVVVIYNAFGYSPQILSVDTRLLGSNGKIYKTEKQIIVPGMIKSNTPGSIEVGIYADLAGEEHNSGPLDFTIVGFKGTPKYSKFYARSKGLIAGGFKGKSPAITDAEKASVLSEMKTTLQTKLLNKAKNQIPDGFILFKDAFVTNINDSSVDLFSNQDNTLSIKLNGILYGILFNEDKLTRKIAQDNVKNYDGSDVYIPNIQNLAFSLSNKDNTSLADVKNISFNLSGATKIVWKLDENKLIADLLGKSKKDFKQILLQYPNIDSADLTISPFWKTSLPDKSKDIKVIVNYPK